MNSSTHRLSRPSMHLLIQSLAQGAGAASLQVCTTLLTISLRTPAAAVCESCFLRVPQHCMPARDGHKHRVVIKSWLRFLLPVIMRRAIIGDITASRFAGAAQWDRVWFQLIIFRFLSRTVSRSVSWLPPGLRGFSGCGQTTHSNVV